jgi:hypothetical protein
MSMFSYLNHYWQVSILIDSISIFGES